MMRFFAKNKKNRVKTPIFFQMEMVECGAAALGIILGYYKKFVSLERLRQDCHVSRDGCHAENIVNAAREYGLEANGYELDLEDFDEADLPFIAYYRYNHFLVVEGFTNDFIYVNDPEHGRKTLDKKEFKKSYSHIIIVCKPTSAFKPDGSPAEPLRQMVRLFHGNALSFLYLAIAGLVFSLVNIAPPIFGKLFIDNYLINYSQSTLRIILIGLGFTLLVKAAATFFYQYYLAKIHNKLIIINSEKLFQHIIRLPLIFFSLTHTGDVVFRMESIRKIVTAAINACLNILTSITVIIVYLFLLIYLSWKMAFIVIIIAGLNAALFYSIISIKREKSMQVSVDMGQYYSQSFSCFRIIETIKASSAEEDLFHKTTGSQAKLSNSILSLREKSITLELIPSVLNMFGSVIVLTYGALQIMQGDITVGTLVAIQTTMIGFTNPILKLLDISGQIQELSGQISKVEDILHYPTDPQVDLTHFTNSDLLMFEEEPKLSGTIEIKNISFAFNIMAPPILHNIDLRIQAGEHIAFVGASGSGKSTLVKLIANLFLPTEGEIFFDGVPASKVNKLILANSIAVVDQDFILFNGSLRDNLKTWDMSITDEEMIVATKDACIHDDISSRENGYDTLIVENGVNFSGGQRQRIEIARALLMKPNILVLDEATSELDPLVEDAIYDNIRKRGCTTIIVAHRLNTIIHADKIVVFKNGKISQLGTHEQLIRASGVYADLMSHI